MAGAEPGEPSEIAENREVFRVLGLLPLQLSERKTRDATKWRIIEQAAVGWNAAQNLHQQFNLIIPLLTAWRCNLLYRLIFKHIFKRFMNNLEGSWEGQKSQATNLDVE